MTNPDKSDSKNKISPSTDHDDSDNENMETDDNLQERSCHPVTECNPRFFSERSFANDTPRDSKEKESAVYHDDDDDFDANAVTSDCHRKSRKSDCIATSPERVVSETQVLTGLRNISDMSPNAIHPSYATGTSISGESSSSFEVQSPLHIERAVKQTNSATIETLDAAANYNQETKHIVDEELDSRANNGTGRDLVGRNDVSALKSPKQVAIILKESSMA